MTDLPQKVTVVPCQECAEGRKHYPDALAFRCGHYDIPELGIKVISKDVAERIAWLWNSAAETEAAAKVWFEEHPSPFRAENESREQ